MHDISSLEVESSITFNVEDSASEIELYCADYFEPPPKGIYSNTRIDPVMIDGVEYYTIEKVKGKLVRKPITDLNKCDKKLSVYTDYSGADCIVVSSIQMSNKEKCLSPTPIRPYRGVKIMNILINNQINSFIKYRKGAKSLYSDVSPHLRKDISEDDFQKSMSILAEQYHETRVALSQFMGKHDWSIYFVKTKGFTTTIQKSIDWRAYDWMCRMDSKEWS